MNVSWAIRQDALDFDADEELYSRVRGEEWRFLYDPCLPLHAKPVRRDEINEKQTDLVCL